MKIDESRLLPLKDKGGEPRVRLAGDLGLAGSNAKRASAAAASEKTLEDKWPDVTASGADVRRRSKGSGSSAVRTHRSGLVSLLVVDDSSLAEW